MGLKGFEEAILDNIFGQVRIANALASEGNEHVEVLQERLLNVVHGAR